MREHLREPPAPLSMLIDLAVKGVDMPTDVRAAAIAQPRAEQDDDGIVSRAQKKMMTVSCWRAGFYTFDCVQILVVDRMQLAEQVVNINLIDNYRYASANLLEICFRKPFGYAAGILGVTIPPPVFGISGEYHNAKNYIVSFPVLTASLPVLGVLSLVDEGFNKEVGQCSCVGSDRVC